MKRNTIELLMNPYNGKDSKYLNQRTLADESGNKIPIKEGVPDFLQLEGRMV